MINSGFVLPTWGHLEQYSNLHVSKPYVKPTLLVVVARLPYLFGPFSSGLKTEGSTFETICGGRKILGWKWEWNRWACGIPWMWMWMRVSERPSRKWMIVCQLVLWDVASVRGTASEQSLWGRVKWIFERGESERWFGVFTLARQLARAWNFFSSQSGLVPRWKRTASSLSKFVLQIELI